MVLDKARIIGTVFFVLMSITGCKTAAITHLPRVTPTTSLDTYPAVLPDLPYHIVSKGETLWRICQNYGVDIQEVVRINHLKDPDEIEVGQRIYLPLTTNLPPSQFEATKDRYRGNSEKNFIWPVRGVVTLFYGQCREGWVNKGLEIRTKEKYVRSPKTGKIIFCSKNLRGYGNTLMIDHGDGFISVIAGKGDFLKKLGEVVTQGEAVLKLKYVPTIIHFEIRRNAKPVNPLQYLR